ncbi:MAG: hypothetical protein J6S49_11010, partial [Erysipelotrichaceae bacterium]|nr:hypothetical protein [Erysipelotrichaceae bacterium]
VQQFHDHFPSIKFEESFDNSDINTQREISQGLEFMRSLFGDEVLPRKLAVVKMTDYGTCSADGRICIKKDMNAGYTLLTTCHECIHRLDDRHGGIAEDVMRQAYKAIGTRINGKEAKQALVKSIGYQAYLKYNTGMKIRFDEQMAWSFESSLHDKEDRLGKAIFLILKERFGV